MIPLRHRTAAELIPIIQPLLVRDGSVSGFQGQLIVRATPANLAEIKRILGSIDTMPRQLLITVRQDTDVDRSRSAAEVSGSVGSDHGRVTVPRSGDPRGGSVVLREGDDSVWLQTLEGSGSQSDRSTQSVRVMEGREAFVRVGQSMPVREQQVQRSVVGGRVVEQTVETVQYRDAATGFYVLPRVSGDRVTLDVSQQRETLSKQAHGGVNASGQQSVLHGRAATVSRGSERILVKVEEVR